jgi:hypothetical protein
MLSNTEARDLYLAHLLKNKEKSQYSCFSTKGDEVHPQPGGTSPPGQRAMDQNVCEMAGNRWEKKCEKNTDCPYYQSNQYYQNTFGRCQTDTGYCQMPMGVRPLTYRKPANSQEAQCYNCHNGFVGPGTIGKCCQEQKSPDYMFLNDLSQRYQARDEFERRGMKWSQI